MAGATLIKPDLQFVKRIVAAGGDTADVMEAITDHIVGEARLVGTYSLNPDVR